VAATLSIIVGLATKGWYNGGWIEGFSIYMAVLFILSITTANEYLKERKFIHLIEESKNVEIPTIRGNYGTIVPVNIWDVVVGDVILVQAGMRVPADCLLIDGIDVEADEAFYNEDQT